jgi:hypothetical protein
MFINNTIHLNYRFRSKLEINSVVNVDYLAKLSNCFGVLEKTQNNSTKLGRKQHPNYYAEMIRLIHTTPLPKDIFSRGTNSQNSIHYTNSDGSIVRTDIVRKMTF